MDNAEESAAGKDIRMDKAERRRDEDIFWRSGTAMGDTNAVMAGGVKENKQIEEYSGRKLEGIV